MSRHPYGLLAFLTAMVFASAPVDPRLTRPASPAPRTWAKRPWRGREKTEAREMARRVRQAAKLEAKRATQGRA